MRRRSFLSLLAGFALDHDRLLWTPGVRLISIPAPSAPDVWDTRIMAVQLEAVRVRLPVLFDRTDRMWEQLQALRATSRLIR